MKHTILAAAVLGGITILSPVQAALVSYWSFDSDASDAMGAHDGTLVGGAAISTGNQGFGGGEALQLNADGDYADLANPTTFDFTSDFTWHARINTLDGSGAIFSRNPNGTDWNQGSNALFVRGNNVQWDTGWVGNPNSGVSVNDGIWHTVIATFNATTDRLNIFIDPSVGATVGQYSGVFDVNRFNEHTTNSNGGFADTSFTIGRADISGGLANLDTLTGLIDDAAVFDTALVGAELDQLINGGPSSFLIPSGDPALLAPISAILDPTSLASVAVSRSVGFSNTGATQNLNISGVSFTGGDAGLFSSPVFPAGTSPGTGGDIEFTFMPAATGTFSTTMSVASNDADSPSEITLQIEVVADPFPVAPPSLTIPTFKLPETTSPVGSIAISNSGLVEDLNITGVTLSGPDAGLFSNPVFPAVVLADGNDFVDVTFMPLGPGTFSATATIASDSQGSADTVIGISVTVIQGSTAAGGIVAYWSFDIDATDLTGDHGGTLMGNAAISTGGMGIGGGEALSLGGGTGFAADYVSAANPAGFDFNSDFTWHAWVKITATTGGIISRAPVASNWNQGSKAVFVRNGNATWDTGWVAAAGSAAVNDDQWHQLIVTYETDTDLLNIFVDPTVGAVSGQFSAGHNVNAYDEHTHSHNGGIAETDFRIGLTSPNFEPEGFVGLIDEVAVFDQALTGADLDNLIENGPTGFLSAPESANFEVSTDGPDLVFTWDSKPGEFYNILSDDDMVPNDPAQWAPFRTNIPATPPTNTLVVPYPIDPQMFFALENLGVPPIFEDDFETDQGWTMGSDGQPGTVWERGAPSLVGPLAANSGLNCYGTNLASDYTLNANVWLRSPVIDLRPPSIVGATLKCKQFRDNEQGFDYGFIRVVDATTNLPLGADIASLIDGVSIDWESFSARLPSEALGNLIKIEFRLESDDQINQAGWYIDDVEVIPMN